MCVCVCVCVCCLSDSWVFNYLMLHATVSFVAAERLRSWPIILVAQDFKNENLRISTAKDGHVVYKTYRSWLVDWGQSSSHEQKVASSNPTQSELIIDWRNYSGLWILIIHDWEVQIDLRAVVELWHALIIVKNQILEYSE